MTDKPLPQSVLDLQAQLRAMGEQAQAQQKKVASVKAQLQQGKISPQEASAAIAEANRMVLESLKQLEALQGKLKK